MIDPFPILSPGQFDRLCRFIAALDKISRIDAVQKLGRNIPRDNEGRHCDENGNLFDLMQVHRRERGLPRAVTDSANLFLSERFDKYERYFILKNVLDAEANIPSMRPNPARDIDQFDLMRELVHNLRRLSEYVRSINDPDLLNSDIRALKAYLGAFLEFLDTQSVSDLSNEIPESIPNRTSVLLNKIDWSKTSAEVRGWVKTIGDLIKLIFSG